MEGRLGELIIGNRIPKDYFVTKGTGQSDLTVHAGSYHLALKAAGVEMCNIMTYSSILPSIATEIPRPERLVHGSVMESIFSVCTVNKGERATAGIIYGLAVRQEDARTSTAAWCASSTAITPIQEIERRLHASLEELYTNGYSDDFDLKERRVITESFVPEKKYGTALVALCFVNYHYPILRVNLNA
ncbi:MAG: pyruvoyl-dependent arginine decarboxylase [Desulfosudis oleivorans]|nr:pyruvoyl-dependent arginine decarboxylase [Desulfosudis oleivorans]